MQKKVWSLTDGHNTAPFLLPAEEGGVQTRTPARLLAKHTASLLQRLGNDLDGEALQLMQHEWGKLQTTWGTSSVEEIQTMLLLEESVARPTTLLSRTLYYTGLVGVTPTWSKIVGMPDPMIRPKWGPLVGIQVEGDDQHSSQQRASGQTRLLDTLRGYLHASLHKFWGGDKRLRKFHMALATAIQLLAAQNLVQTEQFRSPDGGGWHVPITAMPARSREALLIALEGAVQDSVHRSVATQVTAEEAARFMDRPQASPHTEEDEDDAKNDEEGITAAYFALGLMDAPAREEAC
eukprot:3932643-Rhodomonas_salina.2